MQAKNTATGQDVRIRGYAKESANNPRSGTALERLEEAS
jgi:hypothetical protein